MLITHFNRLFARHGRWAFLFIAIVICVPFVLFVAPGASITDMWQRFKGPQMGEMYGKPIEGKYFMDQVEATDLAVFLQWGQFLSSNERMRPYLFTETLKRMRAMHEAKTRGMDRVSDEEVVRTIQEHPFFQKDGTFDHSAFENFSDNVLKRRGIDGQQFDDVVRASIIIDRLEEQATAGVFVSPDEVKTEFMHNNESFTIRYHDFKYYDLLKDPALDPTEEEILAYFKDHGTELRLPDQKRIRVAEFVSDTYMDKADVPEAEVKDYYEKTKQRLYDGGKKAFEDVKVEIADRLKKIKARQDAAAAAKVFATQLQDARKQTPDKAATEIFADACKTAQVEPKDSGAFAKSDAEIPQIGACQRLRDQALLLDDKTPFTDLIFDNGKNYVAVLLETIPGPVPTAADAVKDEIKAKLWAEKTRKYYQENTEVYREKLANGKTPDDLKQEHSAEVDKQTGFSDEAKRQQKEEYDRQVNDCLQLYFVPEQRRVRVAVFATAAYRGDIKIADDQISAYYEQNRADYGKEEVQCRQIFIRLPPKADDAQKAEKRKQAEEIVGKLRQGEDFAALARLHTEDVKTKASGGDLGYFARGDKEKAIEDAAFALEVGQVSQIIESPAGYQVLKLENRRQGRTLDEAREEIRGKLIGEESERLAQEAAVAFANKAYDATQKATDKKPAEVFTELAAAESVPVKDSQWFREQGAIMPFGYDAELSRLSFALSEKTPVSEMIAGQKKDCYVSCWLESKPTSLRTIRNPRWPTGSSARSSAWPPCG